MAVLHHEQAIGRIAALCAALLIFVQAQVMPGSIPDRSHTRADDVAGPCLPSCEPAPGVFYQRAAVLPVVAPAIPESLKRHQYGGPDRLLADVWQEVSNYSAATLSSNAERCPDRSRSGSAKLCTLLCIYRL